MDFLKKYGKVVYLMRKRFWRSLKRNEDGAAELVEAAIIYPVVFLALFVLIYVGLYIMQSMTIVSYTQKIATLAARDVACVGYIKTDEDDADGVIYSSRFSQNTTEGQFKITEGSGNANSLDGVNITFMPKEVNVRAYRYWGNPLEDSVKACCEDMLKQLANQNSIICASDDLDVTVTCENVFITQYVNAKIEQDLASFAVLEYFGIDTPSVAATAKVSVSDTDELVRNTDFVIDTLTTVAKKFGVNVDSVKETIVKAKKKLNLD